MHKGWELVFNKYQRKLDLISPNTPEKKYLYEPFAMNPKSIRCVIVGTRKPHPISEEIGYPYFNKSGNDQSLNKILKAIEFQFSSFENSFLFDTPMLAETWRENGILLLHKNPTIPEIPFWKDLIIDIFNHLSSIDKNITYFLWGDNVHLSKHITGNILTWSDPSIHCQRDFKSCDNFKLFDTHLAKFSLKYNLNNTHQSKFNWNEKNKSMKCVGFTDGSWRRSVNKASYACYFPSTICNLDNAISGSVFNVCGGNNIDAEGKAILICMDIFAHMKYHSVNCEFVIVTDSEFWINTLYGMYKDIKPKTEKLLLRFEKYMRMINIRLYFIPSHGKKAANYPLSYYNLIDDNQLCFDEFVKGNDKADKLATQLTA